MKATIKKCVMWIVGTIIFVLLIAFFPYGNFQIGSYDSVSVWKGSSQSYQEFGIATMGYALEYEIYYDAPSAFTLPEGISFDSDGGGIRFGKFELEFRM